MVSIHFDWVWLRQTSRIYRLGVVSHHGMIADPVYPPPLFE